MTDVLCSSVHGMQDLGVQLTDTSALTECPHLIILSLIKSPSEHQMGKKALISLNSLPEDTTWVNRDAYQMPENVMSSNIEVGIEFLSGFQSSFTEIICLPKIQLGFINSVFATVLICCRAT